MDSSSNSNDVQSYPWPSSINVANFVSTKLWFDFDGRSTNYRVWKAQMLCLIEGQGLVGFIDGTILPPPPPPPGTVGNNDCVVLWRRSDMLLKGWILGSLIDNMVTEFAALGNSRYVWLSLEYTFSRLVSQLQPQNVPSATTEPSANAEENIRREKKDLKEYLPLHRAALKGNWEAAQQIFKDDPSSMTANINLIQSTALQTAVGTGKSVHFVENLVAAMPDESLAVMDDIGSTALSVAAAVGNIAAAIILVNRMPSLLYIPNKYENYPLQHAALFAQKDILRYLISVTKDDLDVNPYGGLAGLRLLIFAIDAEFFDIALELVERYPDLARLKLPDRTSALTKIAAKKSVFYNGRRFTFWERLILCC